MPAFVVALLAFIVVEGRLRWLVGLLGGTLAMAAFVRFLLAFAVPNVIVAGQIAIEEKALSHLRALQWAELQAHNLPGGSGRFLTIGELLEPRVPTDTGRATLVDPTLYVPTSEPGTFRVEGYEMRVYLPARGGGWTAAAAEADPARAQKVFIAYAWPAGESHGGQRVFSIDQDDLICETLDAGPWSGPAHPPPATAAAGEAPGSACGSGSGGSAWRSWKDQKRHPRR